MLSDLWQQTARFRALLLFLLSLLAIPVALVCIWAVVSVIGILIFFAPPKSWEDTGAQERIELKNWVESACDLAPIPPTARDLRIAIEGNPFARRYQTIFTDEPENIRKWLASSPGFAAAEKQADGSYLLKIPEPFEKKAVIAWIKILDEGTRIYLKISVS